MITRKSLTSNLKTAALALPLALLCLSNECLAQGTTQILFDGQAPGTFITIAQHVESGVRFWNPYGPQNLAIVGGGIAGLPENGTAYLQVPGGGTRLGFRLLSFAPFNLFSLDLAEYDTSLPGALTIRVVGYKFQDAQVATDLTTDGINDGTGPQPDFQTFTFDSRFRDLYRVEILSERFSLDNVVIGGVPEPSVGGLVLLGTLCVLGRSRVRSRHR